MNSSRIDPSYSLKLLAGVAAMACVANTRAVDIHPHVMTQAAAKGVGDALIVFDDQSPPPVDESLDYKTRRRALVSALQMRADAQQKDMRAWLDARGIEHRDLWIANVIQAKIPLSALTELSNRRDTFRVDENPIIANAIRQDDSVSPAIKDPAAGIAWGVAKIEAPLVWAAGVTGQGVVVGGEDTGIQWNHPALINQYRGWNGSTANHNFNWHDAVHDAPAGNTCGSNSKAPCDDVSHGSHTAGTIVGDDGAAALRRHQIGVAPGARWIGCRNMAAGVGTPARYMECMQFMIAPTDLAGNNANPDLGADIVSNSWSCPAAEGCSADTLETAVNNLVAAGILFVVAAQNSGPSCATILDPPAIYDASFDAGATDASDQVAAFSSRGPVAMSSLTRPDVAAPGVDIYSSVPTNKYGSKMGTSMATPHVAGAAALLMSAFPELKGNPKKVESILRADAVTQGVTDPYETSCGGVPSTTWPNYSAGYGRVDVWNAYHDIIAIHGFDG